MTETNGSDMTPICGDMPSSVPSEQLTIKVI